MLLGDLGADVIKIEQPGRGDDTRTWGPPFVAGESAYFLSINRNKRSVCLDLQSPEGLAQARALAAGSDVVVENFRPGVMDRLGLGYEALHVLQPRLIYCAISAFGQDGPSRDRPGYDVIVQALGGLMGITGTPQGEPVKTGVALTDLAAGLYACSGILAALYHRERTGEGQRIDVSLLSTQLATLVNVASAYLLAGEVPVPQGSGVATIVPYQAFKAADGYIIIGAANDRLFANLCQTLGHPEWITDPRFRTNADRVVHRQLLVDLIAEILLTDTVASWEQRLVAGQIAVAPVNDMAQVFRDPQVVHSQQVVHIPHPTVGDLPQVGPAVTYSRTPAEVRLPPPLLGEHTEAVLADSQRHRNDTDDTEERP
jgi:crotonobetainyl-CoA:carnitine CoA-transferase CaiB-like acyl-CoA transferase